MSNIKVTSRPRGYVNTPAGVAIGLRTFIKAHGIQDAMEHFGLGRMALYSLAGEQTVQAQTLLAGVVGLARARDNEP